MNKTFQADLHKTDGNSPVRTGFALAALCAMLLAIPARAAEEVLYSFPVATGGSLIHAGVARATDGTVYAVSSSAGAHGNGQLFKVSPTGTYTPLHDFGATSTDGTIPYGTPIFASDGNLYGTTSQGGTGGCGTVYKLTSAGVYSVLASVGPGGVNSGGPCDPIGGLMQASDGNLYGTTQGGGAGRGTLYRVTTGGSVTELVNLSGFEGQYPQGALIQGSDGKLYGTASQAGGSSGNAYGTVFSYTIGGTSVAVLHSFTAGSDGANPYSNLVEASSGVFYGTTQSGGSGGNGTVFEINHGVYSQVHAFTNGTDGALPYAGMVKGSDGKLYGTSSTGPGGAGGTGGSFFRIDPANNSFTVVHQFISVQGEPGNTQSALILGSDGNFYGSSQQGGGSTSGTVYRITPAGADTLLLAVNSDTHGANPYGGLVQLGDGNFYGTTYAGGAYGYGAVFQLAPTGQFTMLGALPGGAIGTSPHGGVVKAGDGNFYGTASAGGDDSSCGNCGTVFQLDAAGAFSAIHEFANGTDGHLPDSGLLLGKDGKLYGASAAGGSTAYGAFYQATTAGGFSVLKQFLPSNGTTPPEQPEAAPIQGADGNFYGTTAYGGNAAGPGGQGTVYKLTPAGTLSVLHVFTGSTTDGSVPLASLIQGFDGMLYGVASQNGAGACGGVFKLGTDGRNYQLLYSFGNPHDGCAPYGTLVQASDGLLYGTTYTGGANDSTGTVFRIRTDGLSYQLLHSFGTASSGDGGNPQAGPIQGEDSFLYLPTYNGGAGGVGAVVRLDGPPLIPTRLSVTTASTSSLTLNWTTAAGAASYNLYQGTAPGAESSTPVATGITSGSHTVTGLNYGTNYYFVVRAVNAVNTSLPSNEAGTTLSVPSAPTNVTATTSGSTQATLSWTAVSGATSYTIYKSTRPGQEASPPALTVSGGSTRGVVTGLATNQFYYFVVQAVNGAGHGPSSKEVGAVLGSVPTAPTGVTATSGSGQVTLGWTAVTSATSYNIYMSTQPGQEASPPVLSVSGGSSTGGTVTGLAHGRTYYFVVQAVNGAGHGPSSSEVHALTK